MSRSFGRMPDGAEIEAYTLGSEGGLQAEILTLGGTLRSLSMPGPDGKRIPLVLSLPDLPAYLKDTSYLGQLVGRYGNRIAGAAIRARWQGLQAHREQWPEHAARRGSRLRQVPVEGAGQRRRPQHLREARVIARRRASTAFRATSTSRAMISIFDNTLTLAYEATTDAPTPISLTWHPYFTLSGDPGRSIDELRLQMAAATIYPSTSARVPTGEIAPVAGTPFDFRKAREHARAAALLASADRAHAAATIIAGSWTRMPFRKVGLPAKLYSPASGVRMRGEDQSARAAGLRRLPPGTGLPGLACDLPRAGEFSGCAKSRELPEQHPRGLVKPIAPS